MKLQDATISNTLFYKSNFIRRRGSFLLKI